MASGVAILAWEEDTVELIHHRVSDSVEIKIKNQTINLSGCERRSECT